MFLCIFKNTIICLKTIAKDQILNSLYQINTKYRQVLFLLIKLSIVFGAFYFIYNKIAHHKELSFSNFLRHIESVFENNNKAVLIILLLTIINWFFEILKWKTLVSNIKKISFLEATKQSLGSLTASLFTPNRIGEYGAKAIYFQKKQRKRIVLLNLIANVSQMTITIVFGLIGLIYILFNYDVDLPIIRTRRLIYVLAIIVSGFFGGRYFINKKIRGFYIAKIIRFIRNLTGKLVFKTILFSGLKYLVFSHQLYYFLVLFGVSTNYQTLMLFIFAMYLIASVIPSLPMFDWLIKGSVAVFVFGLIGVNEFIVITISTSMWLLNFALPSIIGSYFVLNFRIINND